MVVHKYYKFLLLFLIFASHERVLVGSKVEESLRTIDSTKTLSLGDEECPICFESLVKDTSDLECARLSCGHEFHLQCLKKLKEKLKGFLCPLCRDPIQRILKVREELWLNKNFVPEENSKITFRTDAGEAHSVYANKVVFVNYNICAQRLFFIQNLLCLGWDVLWVVTKVNPQDVFDRLGLEPGDRIMGINGCRVQTEEALVSQIKAALESGFKIIKCMLPSGQIVTRRGVVL